jgi:multidrug efflux pump subunit AcrB
LTLDAPHRLPNHTGSIRRPELGRWRRGGVSNNYFALAGLPLKQALVQSGLVRLRAVLVTVFATVGGLIPLALTGGELWRPLTAVHIFGLLFATFLTLVLLPVLYFLFAARLRWIK